jgi:hypothetical protein
MREWRLSGSLRGLGTEPHGAGGARACAGPAQGEEAEKQGGRQACDDDYDHRRALSCDSRPSADALLLFDRGVHDQVVDELPNTRLRGLVG